MILLAASLAAINEVLIEEFMDLSLSSVWLGFLLVNTKIYAVSPAILIVGYAVLGAIIAYRFYIIIPSVRMARQVRSGRDLEAKELHRMRKLRYFLRKTTTSMSHVIGNPNVLIRELMLFVGNIATDKYEVKRQRDRIVTLNWCGMNTSSHFQGAKFKSDIVYSQNIAPPISIDSPQNNLEKMRVKKTVSVSSSSLLDRSKSLIVSPYSSTKNDSQKIVGNGLPSAILSMRVTGESASGRDKEWNVVVNSSDTDSINSIAQDLNTPVIRHTSTRHMGRAARSYQSTKEIITDPHLILSRMFSRHLVGVEEFEKGEYQAGVFDQKNSNESFVLLSEIFDLLKYCWERFHPGSMILTNEERSDIDRQLTRWIKDKVLSGIFVEEDGFIEEEGMTFDIFSIWFLEIVSHLQSIDDPSRMTNRK